MTKVSRLHAGRTRRDTWTICLTTLSSTLLLVLLAAGCSSDAVTPDGAVDRGPGGDLPATDGALPGDSSPGHDSPLPDDGPVVQPDTAAATWQQVPVSSSASLGEVHGTSASDVWAVGGAILHFNGKAWAVNDPRSASGVWAASPTDVWAVDQGTRLHHDGAGWKVVDLSAGVMWLDVWGAAANDVWTVGLKTLVPPQGLAARFDGSGWSATEQAGLFESIAGSGPQNVWVVGQTSTGAGATWRYDGSGWSSVPANTTLSLYGVWVVSSTDVWAVGRQQILHYDGTKWTPATPASLGKGWLVDIWGSSPSSLWAVGYSDRDVANNTFGSGKIYHYDGSAWTPVVTPALGASTPPLFAIWGASASDIWVVGQAGTILRYH